MVTVVKWVVTAKSFSLAIGFKTMLVITKIFCSSFDCFVLVETDQSQSSALLLDSSGDIVSKHMDKIIAVGAVPSFSLFLYFRQ